MMKKVSLLLVVLVFMLAPLSAVQAGTSLKWQEVGNGKYDVWQNDGFFFIENVDYANWKSLSTKNLLSTMKPQDAMKQVKWNLSTVKVWKDGKLAADSAIQLQPVFADSENNVQFPMKLFQHGGHVTLIPDSSFSTAFTVEPSGDAFFLYHDTGIESIVLPTADNGKPTLKRLTQDLVNGISRQQLKDTGSQSERLIWVEKPFASTGGNYIAYRSNKLGFANGTADKEIWLVNVMNGTDECLLSGSAAALYGWVNEETFVYSLNAKNYFYNAVTKASEPLPEQSTVLYVTEGYVAYLLAPDFHQVYLFDTKNQKEYALPRLPENTRCHSSFYSIFFSLSPDGKRFAVFTQEQYNKGKQSEKAIYILDRGTNTAVKVNRPDGLKPGETVFHLAAWLDNQNLVVYTQRPVESDQGPFAYRSWIVTLQ